MMKLRRFNDKGLSCMAEFLDTLTPDNPKLYPQELLDDKNLTESVKPEVDIAQIEFHDRYELGKYLNDVLGDAKIENLARDRGIWAWLSLFYFEQLCPTTAGKRVKPGERARWIPETSNFRKYYRHLLAGPFRIYRAHRDQPECVRVLLCTPLHSPGEIAEQLASRQEIVTNAAIMEAATVLYVDGTGRPKKGAAGRGSGSARRLADVMSQLDMTWDLHSMRSDVIIAMLPKEFEHFSKVSR